IALTGVGLSARVGAVGTDDEIVDPVPIDIPSRTHRATREVKRVIAGEHEARAAVTAIGGQQVRKRQHSREAQRRTEDDIALTRAGVSVPIGTSSTYDDIVDPVSIDIPSRARCDTRGIEPLNAGETTPPAAVAAVIG